MHTLDSRFARAPFSSPRRIRPTRVGNLLRWHAEKKKRKGDLGRICDNGTVLLFFDKRGSVLMILLSQSGVACCGCAYLEDIDSACFSLMKKAAPAMVHDRHSFIRSIHSEETA
jgi:hypothetical protein